MSSFIGVLNEIGLSVPSVMISFLISCFQQKEKTVASFTKLFSLSLRLLLIIWMGFVKELVEARSQPAA